MNIEYTKINDTDYIVSDEYGSINFIKFNGKIDIETVLNKENEIDDLKEEIEDLVITMALLKNGLYKEKINIILGNLFYFAISLLAVNYSLKIVIAICLFRLVSKNVSFFIKLSDFNKGIVLTNKTLKRLERDIPKLENELRELKNEYDYERHNYGKINGNIRMYNPIVDSYDKDYLNKDKNGCKRRILRKDFDV